VWAGVLVTGPVWPRESVRRYWARNYPYFMV